MQLPLFLGISTFLFTASFTAAALPKGYQTNTVDGNRWVNLTSLPSPRQEHATVAVNNNTIAVLGGVERIGNDSVQVRVFSTDLVELYDIPSDTWRTAAPLPIKLNHPNAAVVNERIYLLGGLVDTQSPPTAEADWIATGKSYVYDLIANAWTEVASMPPGTERGSAVVGVHGDMIYVAGGMTVLNFVVQDASSTVTAFNTTSLQWQRVPSVAANMPEGRQHAAGAVVEDTLYVVGGRWFERTNVRDTVFSLDLRNQTAGWQTSPSRMPTARGGIAGGAVGSSFVAFGGECNPDTSNGIYPQAEMYDLKSKEWKKLPDMQVPRHGTAAIAVGSLIYIPGGGLQQDGVPIERDGVVSYGQATAHFDAYEVSI
ncbi:hypothetical protein DPSP01_005664 [Paraphaeosphaeria sporulosa]